MPDQPTPRLIRETPESYGDAFRGDLLEQYKLYVESADRISERRTSANNYLLSLNTGLVALYSLVPHEACVGWGPAVAVAGILVSFVWWWLIRSYRDLNTVKFKVIHELEERLPAALFSYEWHLAERGRGRAYRPLSHVEGAVPLIFLGLYVLLAVSCFLPSACPKPSP